MALLINRRGRGTPCSQERPRHSLFTGEAAALLITGDAAALLNITGEAAALLNITGEAAALLVIRRGRGTP